MTMLVYWVAFPCVLILLAVGCGLLVETLGGFAVDGALLPALGLAAIIVVGVFLTMLAATAPLAAPLVVVLALAGYALSLRRGRRLPEYWLVLCGLGVFAVYAAPIVASGQATFAGYITLDDSATWMALASHMVEHGRSLTGQPISTYEQVLRDYLGQGYPLGGFAVLGITGRVTGLNLAWCFQPTIAVIAAALGMAIYGTSATLIASRALRAVVGFIGAQSALLFSFAFWAGIKEMNAACMIVLVCALIACTNDRWGTLRGALPAALATAALLSVLGLAGGVWLVLPALVVATVLWRRGSRTLLAAVPRIIGLLVLLTLPSILIASQFLSTNDNGDLTANTSVANLGHPLNGLQLLGIWPARDFRVTPANMTLTYILLAAVVGAIVAALAFAWKRRSVAIPLYLGTATAGYLLAIVLTGVDASSPWLDAKVMAEGSPALVVAAMVGVAAIFQSGRRTEAIVLFIAIGGGVLWSNTLAYTNVWLAPRAQLAELQTIGQRFAGDGPTLMTEYNPYGDRYLLRNLSPEGASDRRVRLDLLLTGEELEGGATADLDAFELSGVLAYRTIVLRRSPLESRPPSVYRLVWQGHYYEVWQRPAISRPILAHLGLGTSLDPAAIPSCAQVRALGRRAARAGGMLATVLRPATPIVLGLTPGVHPFGWEPSAEYPGAIIPDSGGVLSLSVDVPRAGRYGIWLGGSFRRTVTIVIDRRTVGSATDFLDTGSGWDELGTASLTAGAHQLQLRYGGSLAIPGAASFAFPIGPIVLSTTTADLPVTYVKPSDAGSLCGKQLDWLEVVAS
jgi:hypothetical protein